MYLWRISNFATLDGAGGLRYSARWHTAGRPVVYLAESAPGAMLEVLAHLEVDEEDMPADYTLLQVKVPNDLPITTLVDSGDEIYAGNLRASRALGDAWIEGGSSALARVPSAIMPRTWNYVLNPLHPEAGQMRIDAAILASYDKRLLRLLSDSII